MVRDYTEAECSSIMEELSSFRQPGDVDNVQRPSAHRRRRGIANITIVTMQEP